MKLSVKKKIIYVLAILVLFILLVIIFGVGFINNNSFTPNNNGCGCN